MRLDTFLRTIEGLDEAAALLHAQGVFAALARVAPEQELDDMAAQWPQDFEPLLNVIRTRGDPSTPQDEVERGLADHRRGDTHVARGVPGARRQTGGRRPRPGRAPCPGGPRRAARGDAQEEIYDIESELPRQYAPLFSVVT